MRCSTCKKEKSDTEFKTKKNGKPCSTCLSCSGKKQESRIKLSFPSEGISLGDSNDEIIESESINEQSNELIEVDEPYQGVGLDVKDMIKEQPKPNGIHIDLNDLFAEDKTKPKKTKAKPKEESQHDAAALSRDRLKKIELTTKITQYKSHFKELEKIKIRDNMSINELSNILEECRVKISCSNVHGIVKFAYFTGVKGFENVGCRFAGLKLQGLTETLKQNEEVDRILKEIEIENLNIKYTNPTYRLAFVTLTTALGVDASNRQHEILKNYLNDKPKENLKTKYEDI